MTLVMSFTKGHLGVVHEFEFGDFINIFRCVHINFATGKTYYLTSVVIRYEQ